MRYINLRFAYLLTYFSYLLDIKRAGLSSDDLQYFYVTVIKNMKNLTTEIWLNITY